MSDEQPNKDSSENRPDSNESSAQEYRLVPVDDWPNADYNKAERNKIDVRALTGTVWDQRRFIFKVTAVFVVIGLAIALLSSVEYQTGATLLPENSSSSNSTRGVLEQFGPLIGIGGGLNLDTEQGIPPELYPEIVNSIPFQLELLNKPVTFTRYDTTVTAYTFFDEIHSSSVYSHIKGYTLGLPGKIAGLFTPEGSPQPLPKGFSADSIITLTKHQTILVDEMRGRIVVELDDEKGTIILTVKMPDPNAAAELGSLSIQLLKEYITDYRTQKAEDDLAFTQKQLTNAKNEFENTQFQRAEFLDQNRGQLSAKAEIQRQRLQSEYDLNFNKYNSLSQRVEQAKIRVQEKTPVVTVLNPIQLPVDNSEPKRKKIVILSLLLGLIISAGYIIIKNLLLSRESESPHY